MLIVLHVDWWIIYSCIPNQISKVVFLSELFIDTPEVLRFFQLNYSLGGAYNYVFQICCYYSAWSSCIVNKHIFRQKFDDDRNSVNGHMGEYVSCSIKLSDFSCKELFSTIFPVLSSALNDSFNRMCFYVFEAKEQSIFSIARLSLFFLSCYSPYK